MENLAENHDGNQRAGYGRTILFAHGKVDPVEAGRKGGRASVLARRLAGQKRLEEKIANGRNGQAQAFVLRLRLQREQHLEAERLRVDRELVELENWSARAREELESTLAELEQARAEREAELASALVDEQSLGTLLRRADAAGLLEPALLRMGFEPDDDDHLAP
jgi:hypothetical protein